MTLEGRIKRLERQWAHPAHPCPDPETVTHWVSLWTAAGVEESQATATALEFLIHCRSTGVMPTFTVLNKWAHCDGAVG